MAAASMLGTTLLPLDAVIQACVANTAQCIEGAVAKGTDLNAWLAQQLPGNTPLSLMIRIGPGHFALTQGWQIDGKILSPRIATLTIVGDGAQRSVLLGSVAIKELKHQTERTANGVTTVRLLADAGLLATPWDVRRNKPSYPMLFDNNGSWTLASWPKAAWAQIAEVRGAGAAVAWRVAESDADAAHWRDPNAWIWGFFHWNWYDEHLRLAPSVGTESWRTFSESPKYGVAKGARLRVLNALSDLTAAREYSIDAAGGKLHLMLPHAGNAEVLRLARVSMPMLEIRDMNQVEIRDLGFAESRGVGISVTRSISESVTLT
jgi:hypothetical protein